MKTLRVILWMLAVAGVALWGASATLRVSGKVLDYQRNPVAGAVVVFQRPGDDQLFSARTGADGSYMFPALPEGHYQVRVRTKEFPEQKLELDLSKHPAQKEPVGLPAILLPPRQIDTVPASLGQQFQDVVERMKKGQFQGAVEVLKKIAERRPQDAEILYMLGVAYNHESLYAEALAVLKRAADIRPNFAGAHYQMGLALHSMNQPKAALRCYELALQLDPLRPEIRYNIGLVLLQLNDPRQALTHFDWILKARPDDVDSLEMAARCHIQLGDHARAAELLERALRQNLSPEKRQSLTLLVSLLKGRSKNR